MPMPEGTGEWSEAFRTVLHEGARSVYLEEKIDEGQPTSTKGNEPRMVRAMTPTDEECCAAVAELCHEGARRLHSYPGWRQKYLQTMLREFGADPELVMELSGLTEQFHMRTDDEDWSVTSAQSQGLRAAAKPKSLFLDHHEHAQTG